VTAHTAIGLIKHYFIPLKCQNNFSHYSRQTDFYLIVKNNAEIFSLIATEFNFILANKNTQTFHFYRKFPESQLTSFFSFSFFQVIKRYLAPMFVLLMSLIIRLLIKYIRYPVDSFLVSACPSIRIMFHVAFFLYPI
jgi:hypothetical protein